MNLFLEMDECTFTTIVHIRRKRNKGKLSDWEKEWYADNRKIVDLKKEVILSPDEKEARERFQALLKGGGTT